LASRTLEEGLPKPVIGKLCITFGIIACVGLCLFLLFFFLLWWAKNNTNGCGIDVFTWLQVFLGISTLGSCILLPIVFCLMTQHPLDAFACALCSACFLTIALAVWIIYGYVIYFSPDNNCQRAYDTSVALVFMAIFLVCGLCTICGALGAIIFVPWMYFGSLRPLKNKDAKNGRKFNPEDDRALWVLVNAGYKQLPAQAKKKIEKDAKKDIEAAEKELTRTRAVPTKKKALSPIKAAPTKETTANERLTDTYTAPRAVCQRPVCM
jgi:hypothetical protein